MHNLKINAMNVIVVVEVMSKTFKGEIVACDNNTSKIV